MMPARFAVELVNAAAIRAFDAAIGLNGQKHARVTVPSFVFGAGTMQRQIVRGNQNSIAFTHSDSFVRLLGDTCLQNRRIIPQLCV